MPGPRRRTPWWRVLAVILAVLLGGCSAPEQPSPQRPAVSSAVTPLADGGTTPAQRRVVTDAATEVREITLAGTSRSYRLHISGLPAEGAGWPLLLVLHGKGGSAARMERYSGLNEAADARGVAVAYLEGRHEGWAAAPRPTRLRPDPESDVDFAGAVIDELIRTAGVDPDHVYVAGFSEGGAMALRLAAERPGWFAAAASVAGQLAGPPAPVRPRGPIPVLSIYGDADPLRPIGGLAGVPERTPEIGKEPPMPTQSTAETVAAFREAGGASRHRHEDLPATAPADGTSVSRDTWTNPGTGLQVVSVIVHGGGHTWPGGDFRSPARTVGATSGQLSAAETVLDFLVHSRS